MSKLNLKEIERLGIVIFLTGTIKPVNAPFSKRNDYKLREEDYAEAIKSWLKFKKPIVFCENSNFRSTKIVTLLEESGVAYEYLSFNSQVSHLGKGHGELEIFEYAFSKSKLLNSSEWICKATGRYIVKNAATIFMGLNSSHNADILANLSSNLTWADSRLFLFKKSFYNFFLKKNSHLINDFEGVHFEHVVAKSILEAIAKGNNWNLLEAIPIYSGIFGRSNTKYPTNIFFVLKCILYQKIKKKIIKHSL